MSEQLNGYTHEDGDDDNGVVDDDEQQQEATAGLTAKQLKEIERLRRKNKKKKESKKRKGKAGDVGINGNVVDEPKENDEPTEQSDSDKVADENGDGDVSSTAPADAQGGQENGHVDVKGGVQVEYVPEEAKLDEPELKVFETVFEAFKPKPIELFENERRRYYRNKELESTESKAALSEQILQEEIQEKRKELEAAGEAVNVSRKKLRKAMMPSIAVLKAYAERADIVEWADITSRDPFLLVDLKTYRNTVPIPKHWNAKRKYLAGKRGFERAPFDLPDFIKRTGIMEMRETAWEKEEAQSLKSKMRERVRPKMGKIDIDYQKLHDAFFKWQTKPLLTKMGELYYEGKELEAQMKDKKPGQLTDELRIALGMPIGPNANRFPPPWLIAMQRYGPPPSYPNLKIPGLNCRIPEGCSFGYHAGGWGKPPVDEYGKPLYGDVFGIEAHRVEDFDDDQDIDRQHWGEFLDIEEEESESEEEQEGEEEEEGLRPSDAGPGYETPVPTEGYATPSGISSVAGLETPDGIELRKKRTDESSVGGEDTPHLYAVLPEKRVDNLRSQGIMASTHVYDLAKKNYDSVDVSLNPEELDITSKKVLEAKYEEQIRKDANRRTAASGDGEDVSDLLADHLSKQNRKRKAQEQKKSSKDQHGKKHKDFKF